MVQRASTPYSRPLLQQGIPCAILLMAYPIITLYCSQFLVSSQNAVTLTARFVILTALMIKQLQVPFVTLFENLSRKALPVMSIHYLFFSKALSVSVSIVLFLWKQRKLTLTYPRWLGISYICHVVWPDYVDQSTLVTRQSFNSSLGLKKNYLLKLRPLKNVITRLPCRC